MEMQTSRPTAYTKNQSHTEIFKIPAEACCNYCRWLTNQQILILSAFFAELTAECPFTLQWPTPSLSLPIPMGDLDHHHIHGFLGPPEYSIQTVS